MDLLAASTLRTSAIGATAIPLARSAAYLVARAGPYFVIDEPFSMIVVCLPRGGRLIHHDHELGGVAAGHEGSHELRAAGTGSAPAQLARASVISSTASSGATLAASR